MPMPEIEAQGVMTEIEAQRIFCRCLVKLMSWALEQPGYELRLGEAARSKEEAERLAKTGAGIANSVHRERLAIDLMLDIHGIYQKETEGYRPMGEYWKTLHPLARWGGDFHSRPDGDHFSFEWGGVK